MTSSLSQDEAACFCSPRWWYVTRNANTSLPTPQQVGSMLVTSSGQAPEVIDTDPGVMWIFSGSRFHLRGFG
jgi:hypothetical protein